MRRFRDGCSTISNAFTRLRNGVVLLHCLPKGLDTLSLARTRLRTVTGVSRTVEHVLCLALRGISGAMSRL